MAKLVIGTNKTPATAAIVKQVTMPTGKYQLLDRVVDDNNTDIGCVVGFHYDANNTEYAIVCLNAQYRLAQGQFFSENQDYLGTTSYSDATVWCAKETSTYNNDKILEYISSHATTSSSAVTHCRSQSFTISGVVYEGQLPRIPMIAKILMNIVYINTNDPTVSTYSSLVLPNNSNIWTSDRWGSYGRCVGTHGYITDSPMVTKYFVAPILEIPNAI